MHSCTCSPGKLPASLPACTAGRSTKQQQGAAHLQRLVHVGRRIQRKLEALQEGLARHLHRCALEPSQSGIGGHMGWQGTAAQPVSGAFPMVQAGVPAPHCFLAELLALCSALP